MKALLVAVIALLVAASGCTASTAPSELEPIWKLNSRVEFVESDFETPRDSSSPSSFYLAFPLIGGDIYGTVTTDEFARVRVNEDYSFVLDLTKSSEFAADAARSVGIGDGRVVGNPAGLRIARVATFTMDSTTYERAGFTGWIDASDGRNLVLAYFDRPGSVVGSFMERGQEYGFNISVKNAGYHWLHRENLSQDRSELRNAAWPQKLVLRIAPLRY